jgi:hypothetical protein
MRVHQLDVHGPRVMRTSIGALSPRVIVGEVTRPPAANEATSWEARLAYPYSPPDSGRDAAGSPSEADMIDSAAFLVRSSAVGQRGA